MKIAIVGSGITGLSAAWMLHKDHDITVFEADSRIGGHSNTVEVDGYPPVDTGFIVYNTATYPNLIALFDHLGVETCETDMSFGVSLNNRSYEYSGEKLFAQWSNIFRPAHWLMIRDIVRFFKTAHNVLDRPDEQSLRDYLTQHHYSKAFLDHHIYPMAAAIWSTSSGDVGDFPAKSFVRFFINHGLLKFKERPPWRTVVGGSREYVQNIISGFEDKIRLNTPVKRVKHEKEGVSVNDETFDHVILACHSDQALAMLENPTMEEKAVLSAFPYSDNIAYLHQDERFMPRRKSAWTSWNYHGDVKNGVCVTYWMNRLQPFLPQDIPLFVTLNPPSKPDKVLKEMSYSHPQYTQSALDGWERIKTIQGKDNIWFCGAWCGYGFHEDGISAGLAVAEAISGLKRPWRTQDVSPAGRHASPSIANMVGRDAA